MPIMRLAAKLPCRVARLSSNVRRHTTPAMDLDSAFEESAKLAEGLLAVVDLPLLDDSPRVQASDAACSLALEHWHAVRALLQDGFLASASVVHRAQFEAVLRSIWLSYAASEADVSKITATLNLESEQAAKNLPQVQQMMEAIGKQAPSQAHSALARFKDNSWKALNSYAHAGIHPLRRHADGHPSALAHAVLSNANGLAVFTCMQAVVLSGEQPLQRQVLDLAAKHSSCMPPPL